MTVLWVCIVVLKILPVASQFIVAGLEVNECCLQQVTSDTLSSPSQKKEKKKKKKTRGNQFKIQEDQVSDTLL